MKSRLKHVGTDLLVGFLATIILALIIPYEIEIKNAQVGIQVPEADTAKT